MTGVSVRTMTQTEFDRYRQSVAERYADEQVAVGNRNREDAVRQSLAENDALLPDGARTKDMLLLTGLAADGEPIGVLWIGLMHPRGTPDCAFLYDIEVREDRRGTGLGRGLLRAAEQAVRDAGVGALMLNVFGDNHRAIGLYASSGYGVTTQQMRKNLT